MIELPEALTLAKQLEATLVGQTISQVYNANSPHKFTFFAGNPQEYPSLLSTRKVLSAHGAGIFVNIVLEGDIHISFNDGVTVRYGHTTTEVPHKYQLLLGLDHQNFLAFNVAMYGSIAAYHHTWDNPYYRKSIESVSPLSARFDLTYFANFVAGQTKNLSLKALLATEQRIPGIGNGVLQDILFNAGLHPKRKIQSLSNHEIERLFHSLKTTLQAMVDGGGRNTENNLWGAPGGYATLMSKNTYTQPCPQCGSTVCKDNYMGGAIYYCSHCQALE